MTTETHKQMVSFIWDIYNLLRGPYKQNGCRESLISAAVTGKIKVS
ncbi:MAG: hypothetical protein R6V32_02165 [Bacteroidales bacterium]